MNRANHCISGPFLERLSWRLLRHAWAILAPEIESDCRPSQLNSDRMKLPLKPKLPFGPQLWKGRPTFQVSHQNNVRLQRLQWNHTGPRESPLSNVPGQYPVP